MLTNTLIRRSKWFGGLILSARQGALLQSVPHFFSFQN
jgi:hypothetical protein